MSLCKSLPAILLFLTSAIFAQVPYGVFKMQDGQLLSVGEIEGKPSIVYNNGQLRGLQPSFPPDFFKYGNALGQFDTIQGELQFSEGNNKVTWKRMGEILIGEKILFTEREVTFKNLKITLAGTLILPPGHGPFPCIVFTHGSGAETRESSRGLAYLFASQGIATMIYDKRGTGKSSGKDWQDSFDNYAGDAIAAANFLKGEPAVNNKLIGIYGHSQGGWIAPLAISKSNFFAFAILSAANAISPVEQHLGAGDEEYRLMGMDEAIIQQIHSFRSLKYLVGITGRGKDKYITKDLPEAERKSWFKTTGGNLPESIFWKDNGLYDPSNALRAVKCPVLVIYGDLDISTDTQRNLELIKRLLQSKDVEYKVLSNANHMMMKVNQKGYATKQLPFVTQFADGYIDTLIGWTKRITVTE